MAATTLSSASLVVQGVAAAASALGSSHSSVHGSSLSVKQLLPVLAAAPRGAFGGCCKAEVGEQAATGSTLNVVPSLPRRLALALLAGSVAASFGRVAPAVAAYGEAANVFGSPKQQSGFTPYAGSGFKLNVPSKWNPSKESEFPGTVLRYEDNFDAKSNLSVMVTPTEKASITEFGSPQKFLESVSYLLGKQAYAGNTVSEGGFSPNAVAAAALLKAAEKEIDGKKYYNLDILTRTADGDEGGTHQLIVGTVADGNLYLLKAQAGDKRWFKGADKFVKGVAESFSVA